MWLVGIDEAGYGPNLGPLVMTSVACRLPKARRGVDLWKELRRAVRRHGEDDDGRLLVADSKQVYSPARGLGPLERGSLGTVGRQGAPPGSILAHYVEWICPNHHAELRSEPWFTGQTGLPLHVEQGELETAAEAFAKACTRRDITWGLVRGVVVCPARFNGLADKWGTKAAVLGLGLAELLKAHHDLDDGDDEVCFVVDKHGGRNHYSALVQHALPDGFVLAEEEGAKRSTYEVTGLRRRVRVTFEPRADMGHFCVALASMLSKYLRELLMLEFNRFWQARVPGLKATAGYPGDAERFYAEIRPAVRDLGLEEDALWRRK
jgi:ribonuclease HII